MAYFTYDELKLQLSPAIVDKVFGSGSELGFGDISAVSGSLRFTQMSEQASGYIDAFLEPAGYTIPVATPTAFIKRAAIYRCIADIYALADIPINEQLIETVSRNESLLHDIATGKITSPGDTQDTDTGTGGHTFSSSTGTDAAQLDKDSLNGTFY